MKRRDKRRRVKRRKRKNGDIAAFDRAVATVRLRRRLAEKKKKDARISD